MRRATRILSLLLALALAVGMLPMAALAADGGDTRTIVTETMSERKHEMEALADAFIVLPGGIGTLDEFFETLTLRSLDRFDKPIVLYNGGGYFDSMVAMLQDQVQRGFVKERILTLFDVADTPEEAVRRALGA